MVSKFAGAELKEEIEVGNQVLKEGLEGLRAIGPISDLFLEGFRAVLTVHRGLEFGTEIDEIDVFVAGDLVSGSARGRGRRRGVRER
jgi:hypothetical protein